MASCLSFWHDVLIKHGPQPRTKWVTILLPRCTIRYICEWEATALLQLQWCGRWQIWHVSPGLNVSTNFQFRRAPPCLQLQRGGRSSKLWARKGDALWSCEQDERVGLQAKSASWGRSRLSQPHVAVQSVQDPAMGSGHVKHLWAVSHRTATIRGAVSRWATVCKAAVLFRKMWCKLLSDWSRAE
jgi:hypothetical protein